MLPKNALDYEKPWSKSVFKSIKLTVLNQSTKLSSVTQELQSSKIDKDE